MAAKKPKATNGMVCDPAAARAEAHRIKTDASIAGLHQTTLGMRSELDGLHRMRIDVEDFFALGFWRRLRWLLTGR